MYDSASQLYNDMLKTYFDEHYDLSDTERKEKSSEYKRKTLFLKTYVRTHGLKMSYRVIKKNGLI